MARSQQITRPVAASKHKKVAAVVATPASEKRRLGKLLSELHEEQEMRVDKHARKMAQKHREVDSIVQQILDIDDQI